MIEQREWEECVSRVSARIFNHESQEAFAEVICPVFPHRAYRHIMGEPEQGKINCQRFSYLFSELCIGIHECIAELLHSCCDSFVILMTLRLKRVEKADFFDHRITAKQLEVLLFGSAKSHSQQHLRDLSHVGKARVSG